MPELRFGADGGNFGTANGYASLAGARGRFDYNLFGDQFNTNGSGINNAYSDSLEGANVGVGAERLGLRCACACATPTVTREFRENGASTGTILWSIVNGVMQSLPPDPHDWSQLNNLLGSVELTVAAPIGMAASLHGIRLSSTAITS